MNQVHIHYYKTNIGELVLGSFDGKLCILDYRYRKMRAAVDNRILRGLNSEFIEREDEVIESVRKQIDEYLIRARTAFDIPMLMVGTDFQKAVWNALLKIPYGTTSTYSQLAKDIGQEKAVRAVAGANGANSMSLVIPCHRIIESNGGLGGYGGGIAVKKRLLRLERGAGLLPF